MNRVFSFALAWAVLSLAASAQDLQVTVRNSAELRQAVANARPGTLILLKSGDYTPVWLEDIQGEPGKPIVIAAADPATPPVFHGEAECIHVSRASYLELRHLSLRGASSNGLNIDDGGRAGEPTHHIVLKGLRVSDIGPSGNRDAIKLSGVEDFLLEDCSIERWGSGGSGVDMVGCHRGRIVNCSFREGGSEGIQAKGGTADVQIEGCNFVNYGGRGVNLGGSTGFEFFRPKLDGTPAGSRAEARNLTVERCVFVGGTAPVAFVGVDGATVRECTIYHPGRWAVRILQETTHPSFVPARNGRFEENIVVFQSTNWGEGGINIGPNTAPQTFQFFGNLWYCDDQPELSRPRLPTVEKSGVYGRDPMFEDPDKLDFSLKPGSPAVGKGAFPQLRTHGSLSIPDRAWFPRPESMGSLPPDALRVNTTEELISAVQRAQPGGTIGIEKGVYQLNRPLKIATDRLVLRGVSDKRGEVVLDGGGIGELLQISGCADVVISDLTFQNVMWNGLKINSETGVQRLTVRNCVFHNIWQRAIKGVKVPAENLDQLAPTGFRIEHCLFYNDRPKQYSDDTSDTEQNFGGNYIGGIDVMFARDWRINDNVFLNVKGRSGTGRGAIFIWHESSGCLVERNIIVDCDSGICLGNSYKPENVSVHCTDTVVRNNMLTRVPENGVFLGWTRNCRVGHNTVWDPDSKQRRLIRAAHDNPDLLAAFNLLVGAALRDESNPPVRQWINVAAPDISSALVNPKEGNLRLNREIQGITDAGDPVSWVVMDIDQEIRGPRPDLGAHEFKP